MGAEEGGEESGEEGGAKEGGEEGGEEGAGRAPWREQDKRRRLGAVVLVQDRQQGELARAGGRPPRQPEQEHQEVRPVVDSDLSRANLVSCSSSTVGTATVGTATVGIATVGTATVGTATVGIATVGTATVGT